MAASLFPSLRFCVSVCASLLSLPCAILTLFVFRRDGRVVDQGHHLQLELKHQGDRARYGCLSLPLSAFLRFCLRFAAFSALCDSDAVCVPQRRSRRRPRAPPPARAQAPRRPCPVWLPLSSPLCVSAFLFALRCFLCLVRF